MIKVVFVKFLKLILLTATGLILTSGSAAGISSPSLSSPTNGSTLSSNPRLSWQAVEGSVKYQIRIDDEPAISSPYIRDYPTENTYYSPRELNPGTYYWKVRAKDSGGSWGEWSVIWSFTLVSEPAPPPTPSTPPSLPPTSQPVNRSSPSPSLRPGSSFTISGVPAQIDSSQSFAAAVNLNLPQNPNSRFFLKGAFKKADGTNYFGLTKVGSSWIKNGSSYSNQQAVTTNSLGQWSGILEIKPDTSDSGFKSSGSYIFKVGRYSSSGSGPIWSNETSLQIIARETKSSDDKKRGSQKEVAGQFASSPKPSTETTSKTTTPKSTTQGNYRPQGTIAGKIKQATPSVNPSPSPLEVKGSKLKNILPLLGGVLVVLGLGSIAFIFVKNRG